MTLQEALAALHRQKVDQFWPLQPRLAAIVAEIEAGGEAADRFAQLVKERTYPGQEPQHPLEFALRQMLNDRPSTTP